MLDDFRNDVPEDYLAGFPWHPHQMCIRDRSMAIFTARVKLVPFPKSEQLYSAAYEFGKTIRIRIAPPSAASRANGMATAPTLKKSQKLTLSFSLRKAISHKIVASDPVIERFGPKSTRCV